MPLNSWKILRSIVWADFFTTPLFQQWSQFKVLLRAYNTQIIIKKDTNIMTDLCRYTLEKILLTTISIELDNSTRKILLHKESNQRI